MVCSGAIEGQVNHNCYKVYPFSELKYTELALYSPLILKSILCLVLHFFVNPKVTQILTGLTIWFSKSEIVFLSSASKHRKNLDNT